MLEPPQIAQTTSGPTAIIHLRVSQDEIQEVMGPTLQELIAEVRNQNITVTGPWFTHHLGRPSDGFDFEISVPVASPVRPAGRVKASERPAMKVARTVYHGGYEGLGNAWSEFLDWIDANGHTTTEDLWEVYAVGPESSEDPADYRTELIQPLR
jgi:effector-binding domain-containing protein